MTELHELFEEVAQAPAPPSTLRPDQVYAQGRRRRAMILTARVAAGVVAAGVAAGVAVVAAGGGEIPQPPPPAAEPPRPLRTGSVVTVVAGDAAHLYAVVLDCPDDDNRPADPWDHGCRSDLLGSDDAGQTWQLRHRDIGCAPYLCDLQATGPRTLFRPRTYTGESSPPPNQPPQYAGLSSVDGGRTWKRLRLESQPVRTVPREGWIDVVSSPVQVADAELGRVAPLSNPPRFDSGTRWLRTATGGIWIGGTDPATKRPAVAVSDDAGQTWSNHVFTDVPSNTRSYYAVGLASFDGRVGYAVTLTAHGLDGDGKVYVHRTADGGATWQRVDTGGTAPWSYGGGSSFVTPDGAHVIAQLPHQTEKDPRGLKFYVSDDGGGRYDPVSLAGLPEEEVGDHGIGEPVQSIPGGGFLAYDGEAMYRSTDGMVWQRIVPKVSR
jgi:hypothetical protein